MEKQKLPGAQSSLILGIFSIVTACCCLGLPGVIMGYLGYNKSKTAKATYDENPEQYDGLGNVEAGKITSLIGLGLGVLIIIRIIYILSTNDISEVSDRFMKAYTEALENQ
ncbi:MAG: hypothetical protein COA67_10415 [Lutibacter sp.]|nr:MAG: hypothetical protein COA67_10415 [Lutibacter sp.]